MENLKRIHATEDLLGEALAKIKSLEWALLILANAADEVGVRHFDTDDLSPEVMAMQAATLSARKLL